MLELIGRNDTCIGYDLVDLTISIFVIIDNIVEHIRNYFFLLVCIISNFIKRTLESFIQVITQRIVTLTAYIILTVLLGLQKLILRIRKLGLQILKFCFSAFIISIIFTWFATPCSSLMNFSYFRTKLRSYLLL